MTTQRPPPWSSALCSSTDTASRSREPVTRAVTDESPRSSRSRPASANGPRQSSMTGSSSPRTRTVEASAAPSLRDDRTRSSIAVVSRSTWAIASLASVTTSGSGCPDSSSRRRRTAVRRLRNWWETSATRECSRCRRPTISTDAESSTSDTRSSSGMPWRVGSLRKSPSASRAARPATCCRGVESRRDVRTATTVPAAIEARTTSATAPTACFWAVRISSDGTSRSSDPEVPIERDSSIGSSTDGAPMSIRDAGFSGVG
ncbi:hypothetical protein QE449_002705 [Rhodococcus sp. SORGH_AS303]|nr:hypothetical protein [Rhodococcus sp. SORGH_AS_0303]